jgi:hypothetical protein
MREGLSPVGLRRESECQNASKIERHGIGGACRSLPVIDLSISIVMA